MTGNPFFMFLKVYVVTSQPLYFPAFQFSYDKSVFFLRSSPYVAVPKPHTRNLPASLFTHQVFMQRRQKLLFFSFRVHQL